jgi:hypothetical protein
VNLPRIAYEYLLFGERPSESGRYRTRYRWVYLRPDWRAYRELAARRELRFHAWLRSLVRQPLVCQLFSISDPLPFFDKLRRLAAQRLPRLPRRLRRWLSTAS